MDKNVEEFQYLLQKENWDEVSASNESNTSFNIFCTHLITTLPQCLTVNIPIHNSLMPVKY